MARILVIDDEQRIRDLLSTVLGRKGHEVVLAENGRQGVERFRQGGLDVTILDLKMPIMNGIEALRQIRAIDPHAPVIILTAVGTDEDEQQARALGVSEFLHKGFSLHALGEAMNHVLSARSISERGKTEERRQFPRFWVQFPITVLTDEVLVGNGTTYDLSAGGCAVLSQVNVRIGDYVTLRLFLPDQRAPTTPLMVEVAAVRWTSLRKFGLEFIKIPSGDQERLRRYVKILETTSH